MWIQESSVDTFKRTLLMLYEPWNWLSSLLVAAGNLLIEILAAPFQLAFYILGWLGAAVTTFTAKVQEPIFQSVDMAAAPTDSINAQPAQVQNPAAAPAVVDLNAINFEELALKILGTSAFRNIQSKQATFSDEIKNHAAVFQKLSGDISGISETLNTLSAGVETEADQQEERAQIISSLEGKIGDLENELKAHYVQTADGKDCCDKVNAEIGELNAKLDSLSQSKNSDGEANVEILAGLRSQTDASEQLKERVRQLEAELRAAQEKILASIDEKMEATARELAELRQLKTSATTTATFTEMSDDKLAALIRSQIAIYDADKTNLPDYALESAGGTILTTRCTESYDERNAFTYYFGLDWLYKKTYKPNNPRTIIQPSVNPGECFAFKGANAMILMGLSKKIQVTAVTMEHIPKSIAINGNIDSAPKDFSIWGYSDEQDPEPLLLGSFAYLDNNQAVQTFDITVEHSSFQKVELRIESNHGHMEYTCIYRFRVHGIPV